MSEEDFPKKTWQEYRDVVAEWNKDGETLPFILANLDFVKWWLDNHKEYQGITGNQLQEEYNYFEEVHPLAFNYSWRAWGALMSAYMNSKEGERKYHYMNFYM